MKKLISSLLLLALLAVSVCASPLSVIDGAGLLHGTEKAALTDKADAIYEEHQFDAVIVTMDSIGGGDPWAWANDYYDDNGYGYGENDDGMLLLLVMDTREWAVSTCGSGRDYFPDYRTDALVDVILDDLSGGDYYAAFETWLEQCDEILSEPVYVSPGYDDDYGYVYEDDYYYDYDYGYEKEPNHPVMIVAALALGFLASMIPMGIMKRQIKNVRAKSGAEDYTRPGSMHLTTKSDRFLYTHTNRVRRAQNNSSGSRSGGHRSSGGGGGRHGGGRGRF